MPEEACQALLEYLLQDEHALRQQLEASADLVLLLRPPSAEGGQALPAGQADPGIRWFDLLGGVLWEIFSQNNEVVSPDGRVYDLGSWRGSGGFIADFLNAYLKREKRIEAGTDEPFFYLDFYMGLMIPSEDETWEVPLRLLYGHFFERLKARDCTWRYAPPAIYLISFAKDAEEDPASYDPAAAVQKEVEEESGAKSERDEDDLAHQLARSNEAAYWHAVEEPPRIVRAYREVYGETPPYIRPGA